MLSFVSLRECLGLDRPDRLYFTHLVDVRNGQSSCDEKGLSNIAVAFVSAGGGVVGSTDYLVQQQASPNNTVLISTGKAYVPTSDGTMVYATRMDATQNVTISANSSGNPRIDSIVLYCDLSVSPDAAADNVAKFFDVQGTPAGSPVAPTNAQILAAIGAGNPYIVQANISVLNGFVSINSGNITDQRAFAKISGGDSVFQSGFANYVASGLTIPTSASLTTTAAAGVLYYNGNKVAVSSDNGHTYAASSDTYVDVSNAGVFTYNGVANGAAAPGLTASSVRIAKVVTSGTAVTGVVQNGTWDSLGNKIYRSTPLDVALGFVQKTANQSGITSQADITGLALTVQVPPGRLVRVSFWLIGNNPTATNSQGAIEVLQDGTQVVESAMFWVVAALDMPCSGSILLSPSAGAHTYKLQGRMAYGGGSMAIDASTSNPAYLLVEAL